MFFCFYSTYTRYGRLKSKIINGKKGVNDSGSKITSDLTKVLLESSDLLCLYTALSCDVMSFVFDVDKTCGDL